MTVKECYNIFGGNYEEVLDRLMREELIQKFLKKFPADNSFSSLMTALDERDVETAFRMAHTLKGICQNLGLKKLYESSNLLTEELRSREWRDFSSEREQIEKDYMITVSAISELKDT